MIKLGDEGDRSKQRLGERRIEDILLIDFGFGF